MNDMRKFKRLKRGQVVRVTTGRIIRVQGKTEYGKNECHTFHGILLNPRDYMNETKGMGVWDYVDKITKTRLKK